MATLAEHLIVTHGIDPDSVYEMTAEQRSAQHTEDHAMDNEEVVRLLGWYTPHAPTDRPSVSTARGPKRRWLLQYRQRVKVAKKGLIRGEP